jgi:hypothetical protein
VSEHGFIVNQPESAQVAAQWHTDDVLNNRSLDGDIGTDGSTPRDRAQAAGFHGKAAKTVAINPALAISGIELINQCYHSPADFAVICDCTNSQIGVWSESSPIAPSWWLYTDNRAADRI